MSGQRQSGFEGLEARLNELEAEIDADKTRLRNLEAENEQLAAEVRTLSDELAQIRGRQDAIEGAYDNLLGVNEDEDTTAENRRRDLVLILERKAEANGGEYAMDYSHVKDDLASHGHGEIGDKQAFRAMRKIAERVRGLSMGTHPTTGNEAVQIDLDLYDGAPSVETGASDNVSSSQPNVARSEQNDPTADSVNETQ